MIRLNYNEQNETTFDAKLMKFSNANKILPPESMAGVRPGPGYTYITYGLHSYQSVRSIDSRHALSIISGRQLRSDVKINCSRDAYLIAAICILF